MALRRPFAFPAYPWQDLAYSSPGLEHRLRTPRSSDGTGGALAWTATAYAYGTLLLMLLGATHGVIYVGSGIRKYHLDAIDWALLVFLTIFFAYAEGYKGFHQSWSPYVVRRSLLVGQSLSRAQPVRSAVVLVLAPFFAAGMFFASRKRLIIAYTLYPMIVVFILLVVRLPHPEHEVVDVAVAVGISLGTVSLMYHFAHALATGKLPTELDSRVAAANGQEGPLLDDLDLD